jgi:hypothetical protein
MDWRQTNQRMIGASAAVLGAASLTLFATSEAVLGPAQDLSRGGDGDPARIAASILLVLVAFAAFAVALLVLRALERPPGGAVWPSIALALAATLFAASSGMLVVGLLIDWQPEVLLGVVNVPAILMLGAGWFAVARSSHRQHGSTWRGLLLFALMGLGVALLPLGAIGGPLQLVVEALVILGWLVVARLIWSVTDVGDAGVPVR